MAYASENDVDVIVVLGDLFHRRSPTPAEYRRAMSDKAFLSRMSDFSVLKKQNIVLTELRDYFIYVVVPSRAKDRVDDIEFIGQNRVKAFTINAKGQRLRLYDLEKTDGGWKIVG